jgi:hypothetical protein
VKLGNKSEEQGKPKIQNKALQMRAGAPIIGRLSQHLVYGIDTVI